MAGTKITDLATLSTVANGDLIPVVDVSDPSQGPSGSTKTTTIDTVTDHVAGVLAISPLYSGLTPQAIIFGGPDTHVNIVDGKLSHPAIGYVVFDGLPKWHFRGAVNVHEYEDSPEFIARRSTGDPATDTLAQTALASAVADITSATSITCLTLANGTDAWPNTGTVAIQDASGAGTAVLTYSTINRSTGVLGGLVLVRQSQTAFDPGDFVFRPILSGTTCGLMYAQGDQGRGGYQERIATINFEAAETQSPDGYGEYYSGGNLRFGTTSPGPYSRRGDHLVLRSNGRVGILGSWGVDDASVDRRLTVSGAMTRVTSGFTLPQATIAVQDPSGFPTSGSVVITSGAGDQTIAYTGWSATSGVWNLTGCTGGTGTVAASARVQLAKDTAGTVIGAHGNICAWDDATVDTTTIGRVGASGEAGIRAGSAGPRMVRNSNSEWGTTDAVFVKRASGAAGVRVGADTDTTNARYEIRPGGVAGGPGGGTAIDILWKRSSSTEWMARDIADANDIGIRASQIRLKASGPTWTQGTGTPEGAVTAPVGSLFSRTDGGAGTSLYVKESGAGNTGWVGK